MARLVMKRRRSRAEREANWRVEIAGKLVVLGGALALLPLIFAGTAFRKALLVLFPLGLLLLAAGVLLRWLGGREKGSAVPQIETRAFESSKAISTHRQTSRTDRVSPENDWQNSTWRPTEQQVGEPARPTSWSRDVFALIEWRRFEALVEATHKLDGFVTKSQSHGADGGVDVWVYAPEMPDAALSVVQCKHWLGARVGVDKVRELLGVMTAKNVKRGQLATTSTFTDDAKQFAQQNSIHLLDINGLLELIGKRTDEQQAALLSVALEGEYWRPTCVNCGIKLIERRPRVGGASFWGCTNYPRCKTTMRKRS